MRRSPGRISFLLACLVVLAAAASAPAASIHESTSAISVPPGVRSVVVDVDAGDVTVKAGSGTGEVHKRWTLEEPTFSSTVQGRTLRITGSCGQPLRFRDLNRGLASLDCGVDVTLAVPAGVALAVHGDALSTSGVRGPQSLTGRDGITVDHAGPGTLSADASHAALQVTGGNPVTAELNGGDVVVRGVRTTHLVSVARSTATLSGVDVSGPLTVQGDDAVSLDRVTAGGTGVSSSSDAVDITRSRFTRLNASSTAGTSLDGVTAGVTDLHASPGRVRVLRSRIDDLTATGDDSVAITLLAVPDRVRLESTASWVAVVVPRSRYAVTTRTSTGHVTIADVVVDKRSRRSITLTADGDISLT